MLSSTRTPSEKRRAFRAGLASGTTQRFPGAFTPLSTRLVQEKGFEGVYLSGAVMANELGLPDVGLTTLTEVALRATQVASATDLPVLVDADTGFGEPMNVARTVQALEDAGVAGLHVEDQVNPKRCGHLDGKEVVDEATAVRRVRAAVGARRDPDLVVMARTDVRGVSGLAAATDRARALVDAGADAVFPEAMASLEEFAAMRAAVDVPLLANMTEFGRSDLFTVQQLQDVGVDMVIFPVSMLRVAMGAVERALDELAATGTLAGQVPTMQTRARLYELVDYAGYAAFDEGVVSFDLRDNRTS
ncbi:methylisocitrate lyase [Pseudokineococcus lusitanus]|uniref:Methylisocitrate lyase n=1 Tax=Pseudokineococcus lusitanus TaxID=763993 RepID=A0A3N1HQB3_9ACTN|nr:methylisocitrate lyase [Pseudokineococcus lusitanus]ROP44708.1 methylisocitrate lyase [Pseudokineococcus lusitanus]